MAPKAKCTAPEKMEEDLKWEEELAMMRREQACFPSTLLTPELVDCLNYIVAGKGNQNGATNLLAASSPFEEGQVRFFSGLFMSSLVPPFSDFFLCIMDEYGLLMLQLHPNAIITMAVFAYLCENFVFVTPSVSPVLALLHTQNRQ